MSDQSGEYEGSEYQGTEGTEGEGDDWIAGSTIEAYASGLQTFSGSIDVDLTGLPEEPGGDTDGDDDGNYVA